MISKILNLVLLVAVLQVRKIWPIECAEQLLLLHPDKGIEKFCFKTNVSKLVATSSKADPALGVFYSPHRNGTVVALHKEKLLTFVHVNFAGNGAMLPTRTTDVPRGICPPNFDGSSPDLATDWTTGIFYLAYPCGKILAYDPNRLLHVTVYKNLNHSLQFIVAYQQERLLIWAQRASIRRAYMDGSDVRVLMEVPESAIVGGLANDYQTSSVYWTENEWNRQDILQCDLQGDNRRRLALTPGKGLGNIAVLGNIVYWQEETLPFAHALYRSDVQGGTPQLVSNGTEFWDLKVLPDGSPLHNLNANPCANNVCSELCAQSSTKEPVCLCRDGYVVHKDGYNCTPPRYIFISKAQGIFRVPSFKYTVPPERSRLHQLNTSNPSHVQCDSIRDQLYWAEKDNKSTKIVRVSVDRLHEGPEIVFNKDHLNHLYPGEELQAFALDWATSNLYMIFHGQRRILACSSGRKQNKTSSYMNCAELFGNRVAASVGGLALDPNKGAMYWTEQDDDSLAVKTGSMDGKVVQYLKRKEIKNPASIAINKFQVYWVDSCGQRIEHIGIAGNRRQRFFESARYPRFLPQRLAIQGERLYWAGIAGNGSSEAIFSTELGPHGPLKELGLENVEHITENLSQVTGLAVYDATARAPTRNNTCAGHPCAGICLLSGEDSFRCVCPVGLQGDTFNGTSCLEAGKPTLLYSTAMNQTIMVKDGESVNFSCIGMGVPVTFDPRSGETLWLGTGSCMQYIEEGNGSTCVKHRSRILRQTISDQSGITAARSVSVQESFRNAQPFSWTYDWIGENVYFLDEGGRVVLCNTKNGKFKTISFGSTERTGIRKIVLDPVAGYMYWTMNDENNVDQTGIWRSEMDGASKAVFIQRFTVKVEPDLSIDHSSKHLFWVENTSPFRGKEFWEILHSARAGKTVRKTIQLRRQPLGIQVSRNTLFWTTAGAKGITSCEKETGNNLMNHQLAEFNAQATGFLIINPVTYYEMGKNICTAGALCSHMCIPTPAGYMRCLCPRGCRLLQDKRNCDCGESKVDHISNEGIPSTQRPQAELNPVRGHEQLCPGNMFPCREKCIELSRICNGILDCADHSDEGDRCNELCESSKHGCSHNCTNSPLGPFCFCRAGQFLADDNKSCRLPLSSADPGTWKVVLIVCGVIGLVLLAVIIVVTFKYRQTKNKLRDLSEQEVEEFLRGDPVGASSAPDGLDRAMMLPYSHVLSPNDIIIAREKTLGSGEFGVVHPGIFNSQPVAIKTFKRTVDIDEFKAVLAELKMLAYLGDHDFIVKFVGAEISEIAQRKLLIVTELSPEGDLLRFLWKVTKHGLATKLGMDENAVEDHARVTILTLHKWCEQIASGMEYLAQKQIVHADLAARNVLVFKDHVVKISDFGLSKQLYGCSQYQTKKQCKLPWRWAAIELLTSMQFSEASDVWAFGVTVWEIFTLGRTPFKDTTLSQEFIQFLRAGNRLSKPEHASDAIYKILLECWDAERGKRPTFLQIKQMFQDLSFSELTDVPGSTGHRDAGIADDSVYVEAV